MALFGLQGLSSDNNCVNELLKALVMKVDAAESMDARSIGNAIFGLQVIKNVIIFIPEMNHVD
jgi:hypothetical protein